MAPLSDSWTVEDQLNEEVHIFAVATDRLYRTKALNDREKQEALTYWRQCLTAVANARDAAEKAKTPDE